MRITINISSIALMVIYSINLFAGTPQLNLNCKSVSGHAVISGYPRGEGYDLKISVGDSVIRYMDLCNDAECSKKEKHGDLFVVEALYNKVFTIYFAETFDASGNFIFTGSFYALPNTIKYTKTKNGYRAEYKAIYDGADPRSNNSPKTFVKEPIEVVCTHQEEL